MCPTSVTTAIPPPTRVSAINIAYRTRSGRRGSSTPAVSAQISPAPLPRRTPPSPCQATTPSNTPLAFRLSWREVAPNGPKKSSSIRADPSCRARHWRACRYGDVGRRWCPKRGRRGPGRPSVGTPRSRRSCGDRRPATGSGQDGWIPHCSQVDTPITKRAHNRGGAPVTDDHGRSRYQQHGVCPAASGRLLSMNSPRVTHSRGAVPRRE